MYGGILLARNIKDAKLVSNDTTDPTVVNQRYIKLFILLPCQLLSILCSLFVFINIIYRPSKFLKPIQNHFIFVLLITSFIQVTSELSMVENYLQIGLVRPSRNSYCLFFNWYEFSLNGISLFVMLWASIERHILIFSSFTYQIHWKRIIFHYLPLTLFIIYTPLFYGFVIFVYNCVNDWDYTELLCTSPCFYQTNILGIIDWLCNIIIPAFTIALTNIILIIRVIFRSNTLIENLARMKKNRKMTIQLMIISSLFLVFWLPIAVTGLIQEFFSPTFLIDVQFNIFFYLIYFIQLFLPFVCCLSLPGLKKSVQENFQRWRRGNIILDATVLQMPTIIRTIHN